MIIFFDNVLSPQDDSVIDFGKQSETLKRFVTDFLQELKKCVDIFRLWLRHSDSNKRNNNQSNNNTEPLKYWAIPVEYREINSKVTMNKKMKVDPSSFVVDLLKDVVEKVGADTRLDYGLYIPSEKSWVSRDKRLADYPQLASEKVKISIR